ncbi:Multicopper oxidase [Phytophthora cinnamomi]|uniref:Multicopper oxidase n=1 Tax=Phytophthora cinnamomi TaxID=4785 RepID=UPI003559A66B|nr:Multicopper oxidase [Phytophthora cinnamomi]
MAFQATGVDADVVSYDWRVTPVAAVFDGVPANSLGISNRPAHEAAIDVQLGQEVEARVTNELDEPTCLHWHGLRQLGTQEIDGVPEITQCNIDPNRTVTYRFTPDKAGSFWWHSHRGTQYAFGLRGPIIVHAPESELESWEQDIDEEYTIQLDDIYHEPPRGAPI